MEINDKEFLEMQETLSEIKATLAQHSEQIKGALKRIDEQTKLTESVHELAASVRLLASEQKHTLEKVEETNRKVDSVSADVEELKSKPAKKWDELIKHIISGLIGALIGYLAIRVGLK